MNSYAQVFFDFTTAIGTLLRSPPSINLGEELSTLAAHIFDDASKLPKGGIKHMFPKHSLSTGSIVQVFHEDHISSVTKSMSLFVVKVFPRIVDLVVKSRNLDSLFFVVFRPLLLSRKPALQQFQLALQTFKKLRRIGENTITGCQKLL